MSQVVNYSRTIEEDKADEFSEIVRNEVRSLDGFAEADETGRDAMFLGSRRSSSRRMADSWRLTTMMLRMQRIPAKCCPRCSRRGLATRTY